MPPLRIGASRAVWPTLLVGVPVIVVLTIVCHTCCRFKARNDSIAYLKHRGAEVILVPEMPDRWPSRFLEPWIGPNGMAIVMRVDLRVEHLEESDVVNVNRVAPRDGVDVCLATECVLQADIDRLSRISNVTTLELSGTREVQGDVACYFRRMSTLSHISFDETAVTLRSFAALPGVRSLLLNRIRNVPGAFRELHRFSGLEQLSIGRARCLTPVDMEEIWKLRSLRALHLCDIPSLRKSTCLVGVAKLKRLEMFGAFTDVFDVVPSLSELPKLRDVTLRGKAVTDSAILAFSDCLNLETLNVQQTPVTSKGVDALRTVLPSCRIIWCTLRKPDIVVEFHRWDDWRVCSDAGPMVIEPPLTEREFINTVTRLISAEGSIEIVWDQRLPAEDVFELEDTMADILSSLPGTQRVSFH